MNALLIKMDGTTENVVPWDRTKYNPSKYSHIQVASLVGLRNKTTEYGDGYYCYSSPDPKAPINQVATDLVGTYLPYMHSTGRNLKEIAPEYKVDYGEDFYPTHIRGDAFLVHYQEFDQYPDDVTYDAHEEYFKLFGPEYTKFLEENERWLEADNLRDTIVDITDELDLFCRSHSVVESTPYQIGFSCIVHRLPQVEIRLNPSCWSERMIELFVHHMTAEHEFPYQVHQDSYTLTLLDKPAEE